MGGTVRELVERLGLEDRVSVVGRVANEDVSTDVNVSDVCRSAQ